MGLRSFLLDEALLFSPFFLAFFQVFDLMLMLKDIRYKVLQ